MIKIFISRPTKIGVKYERSYALFEKKFKLNGLMPIRLGESNYSIDAPLLAVINLMKQCSGAIILGYPHQKVIYSLTKGEEILENHTIFLPTPWNQIEGTLAYKKKIPVLVIAQKGVEGGLFDFGVTGEFLYRTDLDNNSWFKSKEFQGIFKDWKNKVQNRMKDKIK